MPDRTEGAFQTLLAKAGIHNQIVFILNQILEPDDVNEEEMLERGGEVSVLISCLDQFPD